MKQTIALIFDKNLSEFPLNFFCFSHYSSPSRHKDLSTKLYNEKLNQ